MSVPFVHSYTAPDGTTRRPLIDRVPEIRPVRVVKSAKLLGYSLTPSGLEMDAACTYEKYPEPVESALWRCAVEDWLSTQSCGCCIKDHTGTKFYDESPDGTKHTAAVVITWVTGGSLGLRGVDVEWRDDNRTADCFFDGPTLLHALNAAAHAVADAMGVEP